jgi:hypothetical protein
MQNIYTKEVESANSLVTLEIRLRSQEDQDCLHEHMMRYRCDLDDATMERTKLSNSYTSTLQDGTVHAIHLLVRLLIEEDSVHVLVPGCIADDNVVHFTQRQRSQ